MRAILRSENNFLPINVQILNTPKNKLNFMLKKKLIFILLLLSIFLIGVSTASAVELNDTAVETQNIDELDENAGVLSLDSNDEKIGDSYSEKTQGNTRYTFSESGFYYGETELHVTITNKTSSKGIEGQKVGIYVDDELWKELKTNTIGFIDVNFKKDPGEYNVEAKLHDGTDLSIGSLDVNIMAIPTNFGLSQSGAYYKDTALTFKLTNLLTKKPMDKVKISVKFSNGKTVKLTTNSKGKATYNVPFAPGKYSVTATTTSKHVAKNKVSMKFTIGKSYLNIAAKDLSTTYNSGKTLNVKVTNYFTKKAMKNTKITLKIFTGKKSKTVTLKTDSNGKAKYDVSGLSIGTHKIIIKNAEKYCDSAEKTVNAKVTKAKLSISAPKITTTSNVTKNFKVTVKNKETGKAMKNVKVTVKVYTGKKYKTYSLKTNSKGQASISTEGLNSSTHDVAVNVKGNTKMYSATAKSTITVTDSNTTTVIS